MAGLVEPDELEAAATLNNLSYNVAAIVGPALGGVLFAWIGAGSLLLMNAVSFIGLLGVHWIWWREPGERVAPLSTSFLRSLELGVSSALGCPRYRHILVNVSTVFFATIAFAALLPVFVKHILNLSSSVFGLLMGSLGVGAVLGALLLPTIRQHVSKTRLLAASLLIYGAMLISLSFVRSLAVLVALIMAAGMAWSATVSTLNAAAQLSFRLAIRARTLSIYLFVMAGRYTAACVVINAIALLTGKRETSI